MVHCSQADDELLHHHRDLLGEDDKKLDDTTQADHQLQHDDRDPLRVHHTCSVHYQELHAAATALNQLQYNDNDVFCSCHHEDEYVDEAYHELQHDYEDHNATSAFFSVYQNNLQPTRCALFHQLQYVHLYCVNDADGVCGLQGHHDIDQAVVADHEHYGHDHEQWHLQPHEEHFHWRGAGDDY
ncbi:hypothetical protein KC354_g16399 [Hortaea werneckii]|nr:hypothetical protein KC354_g16399 [Hortaea werneckii]